MVLLWCAVQIVLRWSPDGHSGWSEPRVISIKGKPKIKTFWVGTSSEQQSDRAGDTHASDTAQQLPPRDRKALGKLSYSLKLATSHATPHACERVQRRRDATLAQGARR